MVHQPRKIIMGILWNFSLHSYGIIESIYYVILTSKWYSSTSKLVIISYSDKNVPTEATSDILSIVRIHPVSVIIIICTSRQSFP